MRMIKSVISKEKLEKIGASKGDGWLGSYGRLGVGISKGTTFGIPISIPSVQDQLCTLCPHGVNPGRGVPAGSNYTVTHI